MAEMSKVRMRKIADKNGFRNYTIYDMWLSFAENYIKQNPDCWLVKNSSDSSEIRTYAEVPKFEGSRSKKKVVVSVIKSTEYSAILNCYNDIKKRRLVAGEKIDFMAKLGSLRIYKAESSNSKAFDVDFFRENGVKIPVAYEYYPLIFWAKSRRLRNQTIFSFKPARSNNGEGSGLSAVVWREFRLDRNSVNRYPHVDTYFTIRNKLREEKLAENESN